VTESAAGRLVDGYDLVIFDLDGVVYLGREPVPGAVDAINKLHAEGHRMAFATNNASRRPDEVAALLVSLGLAVTADDVVTSAQAAAGLLAERLAAGSPVLVVGSDALRVEVARAGLEAVESAERRPAAVVQGYGPGVGWAQLAEASIAVRAGALWVATNADRTLPSPRGPLPGNGSLVAALATALDRGPDAIVGKPEPVLFERAARQAGARRVLVVGDRLDTDIEGARRAGMDSLLVLTGVTQPAEMLSATPERRPTYLGQDLGTLFTVDRAARVPPENGEWRVRRRADGLELSGDGAAVNALRALCAEAWVDGATTAVRAAGDGAAAALRSLGIDAA
jgi:HAD superfamily hydrolase (TIGR01450 family)